MYNYTTVKCTAVKQLISLIA